MAFRPSQWWSFIIADVVGRAKALLPALKQWIFYGFRRVLLFYAVKHSIDTFWLIFKTRKLGVTYARELSLMSWVPSNCNYEWNPGMRVFIRKCGYHCSPAGMVMGRHVEPWFYSEVKDDTKTILEQMEAKALRFEHHDKVSQAEEMKAVARVLRNFKDFNMDEIMVFFKVSELLTMEKDQVIFGANDVEQYFYGVVDGEINLYCEGVGNREKDLLKVAGSDECIVSISAFLYYFAVGPQTFGELKLHATCGKSGKYYRIPISQLIKYIKSDKKKMSEIFSTILIRQQKFMNGLNDLTGIIPRLHKQSYLDSHYTPIDTDPGVIQLDSEIANRAFQGLHSLFEMTAEDRRLCWVGVLDTKTVLLRRFKRAQYAFYIHKGLVACTVSKLRRSYNAIQFYLSAGEVIGWREAVVGLDMDVQYQVADGAKALVVAVPDFVAKRYFELRPEMCVHMITKLFNRFTPIARQLDYGVRFTHKRANEVVYRRNDESMSEQMYAYLCLSGRLRFLVDPEELLMPGATARYGIMEKGDWFGMVAMYTDTPHSHRTVLCDRYSDIAIVPRYLISVITSAFREAAGHQVDYMARCIHRDHEHTSLDTDKMQDSRYQVDSVGVHTWRTFRMVCVYPASPDIPAKLYCDELARHHASEANVVTREMAMKDLKISEFNSGNEYTLAKWLVLQEEKSTVLFVIADNDFSDTWNTTVAKICDMLQVLVTYSIPYKPDENEIQLLGKATKARKELVFIHPVIRVTRPQVGPTKYPHLPHGSMLWLRPRPWVQRHHHVRMLDSALRYTKEKNPEDLKKYWKDTADPDKHNDFGRVMRWVSGQSVGLILGGGGAKGAAHIGALNYLLELDVPVDYIAGVSIGSFLGALYAVYENIQVVEAKAKELWEQLRNPVRYLRDVSPFIFSAAFRGHAFSATLMYFFGSLQMEDLYIPYFCVSTDLHGACARTHMSGDLWFYVRASMTLTMIFPPQINQFDDHLLMDGGYSDLVPAMAMRRLGIKYLVAINIGHDQLMNTFNVGYHVSGLHCILQNLLPYSNDTIPHNFDIWDSLLYCSARNFIQILKAMDEYCIYIRPNINAYTALDFKNYDELRTAGYLSTKCKFGGLHMKQLPVHIIWYLLRFYTYPSVALSQAQILQGFTDEDWAFAVKLMSKTQMYQRATNTFLKMNLTPYLTDLMEARSYLEGIINQEDVKDINLNVPVLENFSRDDERLDLVHAIARMKEWTYMEDFDNIVKETSYGKKVDFKIKTKLQITGSQGHDIKNARESKPLGTEQEMNDDLAIWSAKQSFSIKDLFKADPTLFHAVASFSHLQKKKSKFTKSTVKVSEDEEERSTRNSDIAFHRKRVAKHRKSTYSLPSIPSIGTAFAKARAASLAEKDGKQNIAGQRLMEFRKCLSRAERYN